MHHHIKEITGEEKLWSFTLEHIVQNYKDEDGDPRGRTLYRFKGTSSICAMQTILEELRKSPCCSYFKPIDGGFEAW